MNLGEKDNNDLAESSGLNESVNPELDLCELPPEPLPQTAGEDIEVHDGVLICELFRPRDAYIRIPWEICRVGDPNDLPGTSYP